MIGINLGLWSGALFGGGGSVEIVERAVGSHTRVPTVKGGAINTVSSFTRSFIWFPVPVRYVQFLCPTFVIEDGGGEVNSPGDMRYQIGVEVNPVFGVSSIPPRVPVLWGGADTGDYLTSMGSIGGIVSDWLDLGEYVSVISVWTVRKALGAVPATGYFQNGTDIGRATQAYERYVASTVTDFLATGQALTVNAVGGQATSLVSSFTPLVKARVPASCKSVFLTGSSSGTGVGMTNGAGPSAPMGDEFGNKGWPEILFHSLGYGFCNVCKAAETLVLVGTTGAGRTVNREILAAWANPTHTVIQQGPNDLATSNLATMKGNYAAYADRLAIAAPQAKFLPPTITPRALSAGNQWLAVDGSDQTNNTGAGVGSLGAQWNDAIRAGVAPFDRNGGKFIEAGYNLEIEGAPNGMKFYADGATVQLSTGDGGHPSYPGIQRVVSRLIAQNVAAQFT